MEEELYRALRDVLDLLPEFERGSKSRHVVYEAEKVIAKYEMTKQANTELHQRTDDTQQ